MNFKKFYSESFDTEPDLLYAPNNIKNKILEYMFKVEDREFYVVMQQGNFSKIPFVRNQIKGNFLKVDFSYIVDDQNIKPKDRKDYLNNKFKSDISGEMKYSSQRVFGSIVNLCKKVAKANNSKYLVLVADATIPSRVKLYRKLSEKFGTTIDEKLKEDIVRYAMNPRYSQERNKYDINIVKILNLYTESPVR